MRGKSEVIARLKEIDLFAGLSKKELSLLADCMRPTQHADGEDIIVEGASDARFFIINSGTAIARKGSRRLSTMEAGQYFGEISLIDRGLRTATVTAQGPVTTMSFASFAFRPVLKANPEMMHKLLVAMCERVRTLDSRMVA